MERAGLIGLDNFLKLIKMRLLTYLLLVLPLYSIGQSKADDKIFPIRNGKIHYETSFALQIPKDTMFQRAEDWIRNGKEISKVIYKTTIIDSIDVRRLLKGLIGFSLPTKSSGNKTGGPIPNKVTYIYNLRVYLKNEAIVTLIFDELAVTGNLANIGLGASNSETDTLYVANHVASQPSKSGSKTTGIQNTNKALNESYIQADAYIKASINELVAILHKRPEGVITEQ